MVWFQKAEEISCLVFKALENERVFDIRDRKIISLQGAVSGIPNYKVIKLVAIRNRLGFFYPVVISFAPLGVFLSTLVLCLSAIFGALFFGSGVNVQYDFMLHQNTSLSNDRIKSALLDNVGKDVKFVDMPSTPFQLGRLIGVAKVVQAMLIQFMLWIKIFKLSDGVRNDMILHSRDSFVLSMVALYVYDCDEAIVTDSHYQRYCFIFSHLARDFRIVQHGFLDRSLAFPNAFGTINNLYIRDVMFEEQFRCYYAVNSVIVFSSRVQLEQCSSAEILLASSFPAIDHEVEYLCLLKKHLDVSVAVKFHPAHVYDKRKNQLRDVSDVIINDCKYPKCNIFVSYNSFMEFDYRDNDIPTVSIERAGGVVQAVQHTVDICNAKCCKSE